MRAFDVDNSGAIDASEFWGKIIGALLYGMIYDKLHCVIP